MSRTTNPRGLPGSTRATTLALYVPPTPSDLGREFVVDILKPGRFRVAHLTAEQVAAMRPESRPARLYRRGQVWFTFDEVDMTP